MELVIWNGNLILHLSAMLIALAAGGSVVSAMRKSLTGIIVIGGASVSGIECGVSHCGERAVRDRLPGRGVRAAGCP